MPHSYDDDDDDNHDHTMLDVSYWFGHTTIYR